MAAFTVSQILPAAAGLVSAPRGMTSAVELWHALKKVLLHRYRPELHYMRGPGPKWHEKHGGMAAHARKVV